MSGASIADAQRRIAELYLDRDRRRGTHATFLWLMEEVGELAEAVRRGEREAMEAEFADVLAWLVSVANLEGIDVQAAFEAKYPDRCLRCGAKPCACPESTVAPL